MLQPLTIKFKATMPKTLKRRTWNRILKASWLDTGRFWHRYILPKHFTRRGAREYRYKDRTKGHEKRKARKYGHRRPLVFTGRMERQAKGVRDVRSTSKSGKVYLHLPPYVKYRPHGAMSPNMRGELSKLSRKDIRTLTRVQDKNIQKHIRREDRTGAYSQR
jgi:hypothetical protein